MPVGSRKYDSLRLWRPVSAFANPKSSLPCPGVPDVEDVELWVGLIECRHPDVTPICAFLSPLHWFSSFHFVPAGFLHSLQSMNAQIYTSLSLSCGQQQQQTSSRTSCSLLLCGNPALCSNSSSTLCTLGEGMYIDEVAFVHVRPAYIRSRLTIQDLLWPQPCYRQEQVN